MGHLTLFIAGFMWLLLGGFISGATWESYSNAFTRGEKSFPTGLWTIIEAVTWPIFLGVHLGMKFYRAGKKESK
jgi:hypothetical protein